MTESESGPSYIDFEAFLEPQFNPSDFANSLVLATNNPSDTALDLSTPLSRVLFDIQEIDTHIHTLTTKSAIPLLAYTKDQAEAGQQIVTEIETQVASLKDGYQRLEQEVVRRYEAAEEARLGAERLWQTVRIGRAVGRCLLLARQLDAQMAEMMGNEKAAGKEDHKAMIRASRTLFIIRALIAASGPGQEDEHLAQIDIVSNLQSSLLTTSDATLRARSQQIIREFSMTSLSATSTATSTYAQSEEMKSRTTSALLTLYTISPQLLLSALHSYLRTSLTSSLASIARALASIPTLDRTLLEVSARCQNIGALETLLDSVKPPERADLDFQNVSREASVKEREPINLLEPLLVALDTSSLPSYFWRSLAEGLAARVADLMSRGGAAARTLKAQREKVRDAIRDCVLRGSQGPGSTKGREGTWEREAAVMVGSVVGALGR